MNSVILRHLSGRSSQFASLLLVYPRFPMVALYYSPQISGELNFTTIGYCYVYRHPESRGVGIAQYRHHLHHLQAHVQRLDASLMVG